MESCLSYFFWRQEQQVTIAGEKYHLVGMTSGPVSAQDTTFDFQN